MLTEEQIHKALSPLCSSAQTLSMLIETSMDEYRAIEQAVRKEMEVDRRDAERWRFAVAPGLDQSMMWLDVFEDWDGSDDFATAIDAAREANG